MPYTINSVLGPFFENVLSPKGWQKESRNCKIPKCLDLIDFQMILPIVICKFDAKNTPDAFKHVPDLFWRLRDRKHTTNTKPQKIKLAPKKQLGIVVLVIIFSRFGSEPTVWAETWSKSIRTGPNKPKMQFPGSGDRPPDRKTRFRV